MHSIRRSGERSTKIQSTRDHCFKRRKQWHTRNHLSGPQFPAWVVRCRNTTPRPARMLSISKDWETMRAHTHQWGQETADERRTDQTSSKRRSQLIRIALHQLMIQSLLLIFYSPIMILKHMKNREGTAFFRPSLPPSLSAAAPPPRSGITSGVLSPELMPSLVLLGNADSRRCHRRIVTKLYYWSTNCW